MVTYTYTKAKQELALVLDKAIEEGEVRVKRQDGQVFVTGPESRQGSPLDVESVELDITTSEIIEFVREGREAYTGEFRQTRCCHSS